MKKFLAFLLVFSLLPVHVFSATVLDYASGYIVLDVESHGEAWYVDPVSQARWYLPNGDSAYTALRTFGLGISNADIAGIPISLEHMDSLPDADNDGIADAIEISMGADEDNPDSDGDGYADGIELENGYSLLGSEKSSINSSLVDQISGRILLQVESHGEAWYVHPGTGMRTYLANGDVAYEVMRLLGLGISSSDLAQIPEIFGMSFAESDDVSSNSGLTDGATWASTNSTIATDVGSFSVSLVTLQRDAFLLQTLTGDEYDCGNTCTAKELSDYVDDVGGFAGIHGTYFCPPDYGDCATKTNSFDPPVFNALHNVMINEGDLPFHDGPMILQHEDGEMVFFHRAKDMGASLSAYESAYGVEVVGAMAHRPSLMEAGSITVHSEVLESSQTTKATRGGIGWNGDSFFLVIAQSASVTDLAYIFDALHADYAMNLDGGASANLFVNGEYVFGPQRPLPNAIVFTER